MPLYQLCCVQIALLVPCVTLLFQILIGVPARHIIPTQLRHSVVSPWVFRSYSNNLPRFVFPHCANSDSLRHCDSHVSFCCRLTTPLNSICFLAYGSPFQVFGGPRFQSISLTQKQTSSFTTRCTTSWLDKTDPNATSSDAITGLSYTAICKGCPSQYRVFQFSPHTPDTSRCPQQPTSQDDVLPFQAARRGDFNAPLQQKQESACHHAFRFRVAQTRVSFSDWVERSIAAPSALRSRTSPITGIRLRQHCLGGWRPLRLIAIGIHYFWNYQLTLTIKADWHPPVSSLFPELGSAFCHAKPHLKTSTQESLLSSSQPPI